MGKWQSKTEIGWFAGCLANKQLFDSNNFNYQGESERIELSEVLLSRIKLVRSKGSMSHS